MIKQYTITWHDWDVVFAVDHSVMTDEQLHEINNFWSDSSYRLRQENGDIAIAVLKLLAGVCFGLQIRGDLNTWGVLCEFDWDAGEGVEGWPKMDGSEGIVILSIDSVEFSASDMYTQPETLEKMPPAPKQPNF